MTQHWRDIEASRSAIEDLRSKYVTTNRDTLFRSHLDRLIKVDPKDGSRPRPVMCPEIDETRGIVVVDGPGGGKTSLIKHTLSHLPMLQSSDLTTRPWVSVRVPSPATLKSLACEILRQTGYKDVSESRQRWSLWNLVRIRLEMLGTCILWIDEAHDLFHSTSSREIEEMLKTLKSLMQGETAVVVILSGIGNLLQIASIDQQVHRRFSILKLPPVQASTDGNDVGRLIEMFAGKVGLTVDDHPDLVGRLIHASRSRFGRCIETLIDGIEVAHVAGDRSLGIRHFAEAWGRQEGCDPAHNIFVSPRWSQIDPDATRPV